MVNFPSLNLRLILTLVVSIGFLPCLANALNCGNSLTTDCLGDSDHRYDPDASDALTDQAAIWGNLNGYFVCQGTTDSAYFNTNTTLFYNYTFSGSRKYRHEISIAHLIGMAFNTETFATSTYERDGTFLELGTSFSANIGPQPDAFEPVAQDRALRGYPTGDHSAFVNYITQNDDGSLRTETIVFLDTDKVYRLLVEQFLYAPNSNVPLSQSLTGEYLCQRTEGGADAWVQEIQQAYEQFSVDEMWQVDVFPSGCLTGLCPTEDQWCRQDPECSTDNPYQEPDASLSSGGIALVVILPTLFVIVLCLAVMKWRLHQQEKRYKKKFAQSVASVINRRPSRKSMTITPKALQEEFQKIGDKRGKISKDQMWEFLQGGSMGEISRSDFNALWAAMDTTGSGTVDFLEFCAFLNKCHDEFETAMRKYGGNQEAVARHLSIHFSTELNSQSMNLNAKSGVSKAQEPVIEEEEEKEQQEVHEE